MSASPAAIVAPAARLCPECKADLSAGRTGRVFCSPAHKTAFHNRAAKRGIVLTPLIMAQAGLRGPGAAKSADHREAAGLARSEAYKLADAWNREDKAAGRAPVFEYVTDKLIRQRWVAADLIDG